MDSHFFKILVFYLYSSFLNFGDVWVFVSSFLFASSLCLEDNPHSLGTCRILEWSIYWSRSFLDGWVHYGDFGLCCEWRLSGEGGCRYSE
jgi:hypothetical protein